MRPAIFAPAASHTTPVGSPSAPKTTLPSTSGLKLRSMPAIFSARELAEKKCMQLLDSSTGWSAQASSRSNFVGISFVSVKNSLSKPKP